MIAISPARPQDRAAVEGLLTQNGLPTAGLDGALEQALVAREGERIVGCAAIERYGSVGLLRSVCVEAGRRGTGVGRGLVERAEAMARSAGIDELYLLTETAGEWFAHLGYVPGERDTVPAPLLASPEFAYACPRTAQLLLKRLADAAVGD
jgi:amino-acid N-acetyltransferase